MLVNIYNNQPLNCQLEILRALGEISSGKSTEFLKREFMHSTNFDIRMNAARALLAYNSAGSPLIQELMNSSTEENQLILKHCSNPLIKS